MPLVSKPYVPYAGLPFALLGATAGVDAGIVDSVVVDGPVGVVVGGADFDPHAAMNRVAARSFDFMRKVLTRTPLAA
jgi:hypothetical protein